MILPPLFANKVYDINSSVYNINSSVYNINSSVYDIKSVKLLILPSLNFPYNLYNVINHNPDVRM